MAQFQHLDVTVDRENLEADVRRVAQAVRPQWREDSVRVETLAGGFVNLTLKVTQGGATEDGLVVRVNGESGNQMGFPRQKEVGHIRQFNALGFGIPLLASFNNGLVAALSGGTSLENEHMLHLMADTEFSKRLAQLLAGMHHATRQGVVAINKEDNALFTVAEQCLALLREMQGDEDLKGVLAEISLEALEQECHWVQAELERVGIPVCLSHNDVWAANILYNTHTGIVELVDYELSGYNFEPCDLAFYLLNVTDSQYFPGPAAEVSSRFPVGPEFSRSFIKHYLTKKAELEGRETSAVMAADIEKYLQWIKLCTMHMTAFYTPIILCVTHYQRKLGAQIDHGLAVKRQHVYHSLKRECGY